MSPADPAALASARPTCAAPPAPSLLWGHDPDYARDPLGFTLRYGPACADVVRLRFGPYRGFLLNHPAAIEHVYVHRPSAYRKDAWTRQARSVMGQGLLLSEGPLWRAQRRRMTPAFHRLPIERYATGMVEICERFASARAPDEPFDLYAEMSALALDIVARSLFGADLSPHARTIPRAVDVGARCLQALFERTFPLPSWLPTPTQLALRRATRDLDRVVASILAARRDAGPRAAADDLLGRLLAADAAPGEPSAPRQLRDEVITLLLAGHETTALALTYALRLVALHPPAQAALERELDQVLAGAPPTAGDLARLPYLDAVVKEALRLYPPVWASARQALSPDLVRDVPIPRGALLFVSLWAVHRDPLRFPDPDTFAPARWLPAGSLEAALPRCAYLPFGAGPRVCIGASFAMTELRLALACLLRRHRLLLEDPAPPPLLPSITLRLGAPVRARLVPRQHSR